MRKFGDPRTTTGASDRQYRRGAIMGMTMAETFLLITFALLLLLGVWKIQSDAQIEKFMPVHKLDSAQLTAVGDLANQGKLDATIELIENGLDLQKSAGMPNPADHWRFIDSDELRRMLDASAELPEDLQRDIADLVEIEEPNKLQIFLNAARRVQDDETSQLQLAGIAKRINEAQRLEQAMVGDLKQTLGVTVAGIGGYIEANGSLVLPDTALFETGSAEITPEMLRFLNLSCEPWMRVLMRAETPVAGAQIEGHASSEWSQQTSPDQAYLYNLDLSQRRALSVLNTCLNIVDDDVKVWAHRHLSAVGYSSGRRITENGQENRVKSRRVVFSIELDQRQLLDDVESDVGKGLNVNSSPVGDRKAELFSDLPTAGHYASKSYTPIVGKVTKIADGDTFTLGNQAIRLEGLHAPELNQPFGPEARQKLSELTDAQSVTCWLGSQTTFNRKVAVCFVQGTDIAAEIIAAGLGRDCIRFSDGRYKLIEEDAGESVGPLPDYCTRE